MRVDALVFKIVGEAEWRQSRSLGVYTGSDVDRRDGFIHFSAADQVQSTAQKWFAGRTDLWLIAVDAELLGSDLRWEPSRGGDLFPHLYASLAMSAVVWERSVPLDEAGQFLVGRLS